MEPHSLEHLAGTITMQNPASTTFSELPLRSHPVDLGDRFHDFVLRLKKSAL
jgi:hypothetical protein